MLTCVQSKAEGQHTPSKHQHLGLQQVHGSTLFIGLAIG